MKKIIGFLLALVMVVSLIPERAYALRGGGGDVVEYIDYDSAGQKLDQPGKCTDYTEVDISKEIWKDGWYVVKKTTCGGYVTITDRISVEGVVNLILCDDVTLEAERGINVSENSSLTIYGQEEGTGGLIATANDEINAGIGGGSNGAGGNYSGAGGSITINGGNVSATGGVRGAGIGGGDSGAGGSITINGGNVTATGGESGAGIGGGFECAGGSITITGGNVTAKSVYGAGIGGGESGAGGTITITGGNVTAKSDHCAGIGGGDSGAVGSITITGGEITATGGAVGIGGSVINDNDKVVVNNEKLIYAGESEQNTDVVPNEGFKGDNSYKYVRIEKAHTHDNITFKPWSEGASLPSQAGNYYLTTDVTLSGTWTVPTGKTNLCLNGHVISGSSGMTDSMIIQVSGAESTLNIYDCDNVSVHNYNDTDGYWKLDEFGGKQVTGGIITANGLDKKCVFISGGTLTLNGGTVCGSNGMNGIFLNGGSFTMNGGSICGNKYINNINGYGGGIRMSNGTFTMNGGEIKENSATRGGGVYVGVGTFTMNGGNIQKNKADWGGGVYAAQSEGAFTLVGGRISENVANSYGGGVFARENSKVKVGGKAVVKGNETTGLVENAIAIEESNIHLQNNKKGILTATDDSTEQALKDGADIGVTLWLDGSNLWEAGTEVGSYFGDTLTANNYKYFTMNNSGPIDIGTVYNIAQIGTDSEPCYVRGGKFSVTGYTDASSPSLGSVTADCETCKDGATVILTVSPTAGYMLTKGSLKASYINPADTSTGIDCTLTQDAQDSTKYTFTMPAAAVTVTAVFEKLAAYVSEVPQANTLVYTGAAQALVSAGEAENGTMQYALGTSDAEAPESGWSVEIPKGISAEANSNTYYVWYKAVGSDGALNSEAACVTVSIAKKDITNATVGAFEKMTYTGQPQTPGATVTIDGLTVTGSWSEVTNVADTTTFTANGNFTGSITGKVTGMAKRTPAEPAGLDGVKPSEIGRSDGKITGTTAAMEYSTTADFTDAKDCKGTEITGLAAGTYFVRFKETANENAGNYVSVTVSNGDKKNFTGIVVENYSGAYDGQAHGITVSGVPVGATVAYGMTEGTYNMNSSATYTDFTDGAKTVYVKVSAENYNDYFSSGTVTVSKKDVTNATVGAFEKMTYNGQPQTPDAAATIDGLTVTGSWSDVTNVADTTTFTANGNFTGSITGRVTGMDKRTPAAPAGLDGVKPSEIGRSDGKITGTTAAMEYSTNADFTDAKDCTGTEITGLAAGTYLVRFKETSNENAGNYVSVTVSNGDKKNFTGIVVENYSGEYDGQAHGITVSGVPAGAAVMYGTTEGIYDRDSITYTDFTDGAKTVYVKVSAENYNDWFGSGTVTITKSTPPTPPTPDYAEWFMIPVSSDTAVKVGAQVNNGNAVLDEIRESDLKKISSDSEKKELTVSVDLSKVKDVTGVLITKNSLKNISGFFENASLERSTLEIKLQKATLELDVKALGAVIDRAEGNNIRFIVRDINLESLNAAQRAAISDKNVEGTFETCIESNGIEIHDFKGGTVEVSKFSGAAVMNRLSHEKNLILTVYKIKENGELEKYATEYDKVTGYFTYTSGSFSDYVIILEEEPEVIPDDKEDKAPTAAEISKNSLKLNKKFSVSQTTEGIDVVWGKVADADGYYVYAGYCGQKNKKAATLKGCDTTEYTITSLNGEAIRLKKNYKVIVKAYKLINGKKTVIGKTIIAHAVGIESKKYTNPRKIKLVNGDNLTLKVGETSEIAARIILEDSSKKQLSDKHAKEFRYASGKESVATVDANGVITAKKQGKCTIYIYARNGKAKKITVTVE